MVVVTLEMPKSSNFSFVPRNDPLLFYSSGDNSSLGRGFNHIVSLGCQYNKKL
jgi:hypothetical protein